MSLKFTPNRPLLPWQRKLGKFDRNSHSCDNKRDRDKMIPLRRGFRG